MSDGIEKDLLETQKVNSWFDDFTIAVQQVLPNWATLYIMVKGDEVDRGTLTYRTLANDFRKEIRSRAKGGKGFKPGAFGPIYG